ncbi:hypothetical protein ABH15_03680 [Methanoculleus taiwanensis]|uniref:Uncharacterized protein n=1 Tax=Methanoculleus taiwanensis TaxID=1550565 RepID=A0A498H2D7_9EURY|nr:hypothetical protein [Methanoculleus taiwanensis]RXE57221.1 hypothetical protein ABH15_03680 [Methanoculleus taiwanensis]
MILDDMLYDIASIGLYNLWKATHQVRKTVRSTGMAVEEITGGIGDRAADAETAFSSAVHNLLSFISELEDLVAVRDGSFRGEDELLDVDVRRLSALRVKERELLEELARYGEGEPPAPEEKALAESKLAIVRNAIHGILDAAEPGVIPTGLYDARAVLERFNTLEQPEIEEIFAATLGNLAGFESVLGEVEKLFVVRRDTVVDPAGLSKEKQDELARLQSSLILYDRLIEKTTRATIRLQEELLRAYPEEAVVRTPVPPGTRERGASAVRAGSETPHPVLPGEQHPAPGLRPPKSVRIARVMGRTDITAVLANLAAMQGINRYYERERLKVERKIARLLSAPVDEPGVLPRSLDEMRLTIERFRVSGQPRLEMLVDTLTEVITESRTAAANTNRTFEVACRFADGLSRNRLLLVIGFGVFAALLLASLVVLLIILVEIALIL